MVRSAAAGGGASGRPVREARPFRAGACACDDRWVGGAGARTWGRRPAEGTAGAWLPHPAWRTRAPYLGRPAPARGASAWAGDWRSSGGTCVRKATSRVGRKRPSARRLAAAARDPAWLLGRPESGRPTPATLARRGPLAHPPAPRPLRRVRPAGRRLQRPLLRL